MAIYCDIASSCIATRSIASRDFLREFPSLREETEDSDDYSVPAPVRNQHHQNQHNDQEEIQQLQDSHENQMYDLSMDGYNLEHHMHTSNDMITSSNESLDNATAILPKAKSYKHVRRTLSGALEVGGYLGVTVAARASPHMERRHPPQEEEQQKQPSGEYGHCHAKYIIRTAIKKLLCMVENTQYQDYVIKVLFSY